MPKKETWSHFCDFYIEEHIVANKLRWDHTFKYKMKVIRKQWADRPIDSIRVADVQAFINTFKKRNLAPATMRYYYVIVKNMLDFAAKMQWLEQSPLKAGQIELPKVQNERTRRLALAEEDALFEVMALMEQEPASDLKPARRFIRAVVTLTLDTGLRRGSIMALQFKTIQWDEGKHGVLDVPPEILKQRRPQRLALTERARKVLEQRRKFYFAQGKFHPEAYVFGKDDGTAYIGTCSFEQAWQETKRRANLADTDLHFHDLRGEAASRLSEMGKPLSVIQRFLGHKSLQMTQRYLRARIGEVEETAEALEGYRATKGATKVEEALTS
jgi:integrase